jgi:hypothetical protein
MKYSDEEFMKKFERWSMGGSFDYQLYLNEIKELRDCDSDFFIEKEYEIAKKKVKDWLDNHNDLVFVLSGLPMVGKTRILSEITEEYNGLYVDCSSYRDLDFHDICDLASRNTDIVLCLDEVDQLRDGDNWMSTKIIEHFDLYKDADNIYDVDLANYKTRIVCSSDLPGVIEYQMHNLLFYEYDSYRIPVEPYLTKCDTESLCERLLLRYEHSFMKHEYYDYFMKQVFIPMVKGEIEMSEDCIKLLNLLGLEDLMYGYC